MADKDIKINIATEADTSGAADAAKALDNVAASNKELDQSTVRIADVTRKATAEIDENRRALKEWQQQRDETRRGRGGSLASDPAEFYEAEARAARRVAEAEEELARAKQAAADAAAAKKKADQEAREASRRLREETRLANQELANKRRTLNSLATAANAAGARLGVMGTAVRSLLNPWALAGAAIGVVTAKVVDYARESFNAARAAKDLADANETKWEVDKTKRLLGLYKSFVDLDKARSALLNRSLAQTYAEEDEQLRLQTESLKHNIEMHKKRVEAAGAIDRINTRAQIDETQDAAARGRLPADQAAARVAALEESLRRRELERTIELSMMDDAIAATSLAAKQQELKNAKQRLEDAHAREAALEAERDALEAEQRRRTEIDQLRASVAEAGRMLDEFYQGFGSSSGVSEDLRTLKEAESLRERANNSIYTGKKDEMLRLAELIEQLVNGRSALQNLEDDNNLPRATDVIVREREALVKELTELTTALTDARQEIERKELQLAAAEQDTRQQMEQRQQARSEADALAAAEAAAEAARRAREEAARRQDSEIEKLETLAGQLGDGKEVAPVVKLINDAIKDRELTAQEMEAVAGSLQQYQRAIGDLGSEFLGFAQETTARLNSYAAEIRTLKAQQGHKSP